MGLCRGLKKFPSVHAELRARRDQLCTPLSLGPSVRAPWALGHPGHLLTQRIRPGQSSCGQLCRSAGLQAFSEDPILAWWSGRQPYP